MKIINEALLNDFRRAPCCEVCFRKNRSGLQPHHYRAKGIGGAWRMDVRINLIALCLFCHRKAHDGNVSRKRILEIIAAREGRTPEEVTAELDRLRQQSSK